MARSVFESINAKRELEGEASDGQPPERRRRVFAAAGSQDLRPAAAGHRRCSTCSWRRAGNFTSHAETLDYLASQRFKVIPHKTLRGTIGDPDGDFPDQ